jgi:hypothetical protein
MATVISLSLAIGPALPKDRFLVSVDDDDPSKISIFFVLQHMDIWEANLQNRKKGFLTRSESGFMYIVRRTFKSQIVNICKFVYNCMLKYIPDPLLILEIMMVFIYIFTQAAVSCYSQCKFCHSCLVSFLIHVQMWIVFFQSYPVRSSTLVFFWKKQLHSGKT